MIEVLKQMIEAHDELHKARVDYGLSASPVIGANHERLKLRLEEARHNNEIAIEKGRQAIAELESQEPVAWRIKVETKLRDGSVDVGYQLRNEKLSAYDEPLYTHPPHRTEQEPVEKPAAVVSSCTGAGDKGVRVKWLGGFPQIGDRLYTHPPQRTWVVFPTMLRKMWSGGEVQAWLDENVNKEKNHGN